MISRLPRATVLALVIVALGFGLRLFRLDAQSFWYDEATVPAWPVEALTQILSNDFYERPPALVLSSRSTSGSMIDRSDLTLRLLSAMLGAAGIAGCTRLGKATVRRARLARCRRHRRLVALPGVLLPGSPHVRPAAAF